ncbi:hypothetical protein CHS0354_017448, partial [Potamilus streckersoni]
MVPDTTKCDMQEIPKELVVVSKSTRVFDKRVRGAIKNPPKQEPPTFTPMMETS